MPETKVGVVTHRFGKHGVAVIKATGGPISAGDRIHIKGHTTDHTRAFESMPIEHLQVPRIEVGQDVGIKTSVPVHEHDEVYKVTD